ncbi:hypothetical protein KR054_006066 [Drosophila jambulina]|nr:hypothetical protein KR054_006066 [Drosophila jambulina]
MKLLPLLWLLSSLLLVAGNQDPPIASATKPPIANNATVVTLGNATSSATGTPIAGGSPADKTQSNKQTPVKVERPKEAEKSPAVPESAGKTRKRTDTDNPKPAGNATVNAVTPKPAGGESKPSTAAAGAPAPAAPSAKPNANETVATKATNVAKPTAGSTIVADGQSMKDVTKANNATSHPVSNVTITSTSTTAPSTIKTTPKPTKPPVVFSMDTHAEWEQKQEQQSKTGDKPGTLPKPASTLGEPLVPQVQELTGTLADRGDTSYVVPIVTVLLTVPLAIGVVTIMYRRFRDMWTTRHYRRMDFLVDGMYND